MVQQWKSRSVIWFNVYFLSLFVFPSWPKNLADSFSPAVRISDCWLAHRSWAGSSYSSLSEACANQSNINVCKKGDRHCRIFWHHSEYSSLLPYQTSKSKLNLHAEFLTCAIFPMKLSERHRHREANKSICRAWRFKDISSCLYLFYLSAAIC